jgi:hypothetical protein
VIRDTRWRAVIEVEFTTRDYPAAESATAEIQASWFKRATERSDREVNCSRSEVRLTSVERVA